MVRKRIFLAFIAVGLLALAVGAIALFAVRPARAQCGSQASSCKSCHETQAKDPVNADGSLWHPSHAFGDFCYICHGGNQQATDQTAAHLGLVSPLADVNASCQQCHPADLNERAGAYAVALGVSLNDTGGSIPQAAEPTEAVTAATEAAVAAVEPSAPQDLAPASADSDLVDYVAQYNEDVLGQTPTNWGNVILVVMLATLALGGGVLVARREGWIRVSFKETRPLDKEYPAEVIALAGEVAALKPDVRASLRRLLSRPEAGELFSVIDRMSQTDTSEESESPDPE